MKKTNEQKGITLVALIITIIVLLILAVVAISAVSGDGILGYAKKSTEDYKLAQAKEKAQLILDEWKIVKHTIPPEERNLLTFLQSKLGEENVKQNGEAYVVTIDGYEIMISNEQIMSKEEFENMPVTGETIATNVVRVGDFVYVITDESNKTVEAHGYRGDEFNYTDSIPYNFIMTLPIIESTELKVASKVEINGEVYTVTGFGMYPFGLVGIENLTIQKITIPGTITSINSVISNCNTLTDLVILEGNEEVTINNSFNYCTSLKNVTIPSNVKTITDSFNDCDSNDETDTNRLNNVSIKDSTNINNSFLRSDWIMSGVENGLLIKNNVLIDGTMATGSVEIPSNVTSIGNGAFTGNTVMTSITIPNSVTEIGSNAFSGCTSLEEVSIPDNITSIPDYAFSGCTSLKSMLIPDTVTYIGLGAFSNCTNLSSINIPDGITIINAYTFSRCSALKNISIPESVNSISLNAFEYSGITNFEWTTSITSIAQNAFMRSALTTLTVDEGIETITSQAFNECAALKNVSLPNSLKIIEDGAFANCTSLATITIPDSVTTIKSAFYGCTSLATVNYSGTLTYIDVGVFNNTALYNTLKADSEDGYIVWNGILLEVPVGVFASDDDDINIPDRVHTIAEHALGRFYEPIYRGVTIPSTVQYVCGEIFYSVEKPALSFFKVNWPGGTKPEGWVDNWNNSGVEPTIINTTE